MNDGTSRREFLGTLAAFSLFPLEQEKPELILYNGNILTVNDREPRAQAVAIARGRFLAVGSDSDVLNLASAASKKIDLGRKTVSRVSLTRSEEHTSELQSLTNLVCRLLLEKK